MNSAPGQRAASAGLPEAWSECPWVTNTRDSCWPPSASSTPSTCCGEPVAAVDQRRYPTTDQIGVVSGARIRTGIEARNKGDVHEVLLPERAANPNRVNYTVGP